MSSSTAVTVPAGRETRAPDEALAGLDIRTDSVRDWRLHRHADYQRVYQSSRKQFSSLMSYFAAAQLPEQVGSGPRIGITAGKVLGKAVERNRIKRRLRAAIVSSLPALDADVDLVLHPKRSVLDAEWAVLVSDVRRVFERVQRARCERQSGEGRSPQKRGKSGGTGDSAVESGA